MTRDEIDGTDQSAFNAWLREGHLAFNDDEPWEGRLPADRTTTEEYDSDPGRTPRAQGDTPSAVDVAKRHPWMTDYPGRDGDRSTHDWKVTCWMLRYGVPKNEVETFLAQYPDAKVAERDEGIDYGDTWENAVEAVGTDRGQYVLSDSASAAPVPPRPGETEITRWSWVRAQYDDPDVSIREARHAALQALLDENEFIAPRDNGKLHVYQDRTGTYTDEGEQIVNERLTAKLGSASTIHERNEIVENVRNSSFVDRETLEAGDRTEPLVCVANGVLDVADRELHEHDPEYRFTSSIPWPYDPAATGDAIDAFLDEITDREAEKRTLYEMLGNCLLGHYDYEGFLVLFGEGKNGKSTFFELAEIFLGAENVSGITAQQLSSNRFATSSLVGKYANIAPDMPGTKIRDLSTIKALTGGDWISAEEKGQPHFEFRNRAKLMFGANRPPVLGEQSMAIKRRLYPIQLPYQFTAAPDDGNPMRRDRRELMQELTQEDEMSGLLNRVLDGLDRLRANGEFSLPEGPDERLEYYQQFADPIKEFRVQCLENERGRVLPKDEIYTVYKRFCQENDYAVKDRNVFFRQLRQTTFEYREWRPNLLDGRPRLLRDAVFAEGGERYVSDMVTTRVQEVESALGIASGDDVDAVPLAKLSPGDEHAIVEGKVEDISAETPPEIDETASLVDTSGTIRTVVWVDADKASLQEGAYYRFSDVRVGEYENQPNLWVQAETTIEQIEPGEGNTAAPEPDPDGNLSDWSGQTEEGEEGARKTVLSLIEANIQEVDGGAVPHGDLVEAAKRAGITEDRAEHVIERLLEHGTIYEPASGSGYRIM